MERHIIEGCERENDPCVACTMLEAIRAVQVLRSLTNQVGIEKEYVLVRIIRFRSYMCCSIAIHRDFSCS